jgi:hypothetical protein
MEGFLSGLPLASDTQRIEMSASDNVGCRRVTPDFPVKQNKENSNA